MKRSSWPPSRTEHNNVDAEEFLSLMSEFNEAAADNVQALRQRRLPEPASERRGALLQAQAAVAILVLPGLARRMQQSRGWRTMKSLLAEVYLTQEIHRHGRAAVVLDFCVRPFVHAHPREASQGGASTINLETLRHLVREGKLSKAIQLARTKYDAEVRHLPTTARPTKEQIERTVRGEPQAAAADAIIPTHEDLPPQDWRTLGGGGMEWGPSSEEERAERSVTFGGKPVRLRLGLLEGGVGGAEQAQGIGSRHSQQRLPAAGV